MVLDLPEILEISIFLKTIGFYNENGHQRDLENHQKSIMLNKPWVFDGFGRSGSENRPLGLFFSSVE